jgi:apolipoprotein D and lipocalin family protein
MNFVDNSSQKLITTENQINLYKYIGKWYELARLSNTFTPNNATVVTVEYSLNNDNTVTVVNKAFLSTTLCQKIEGIARVLDSSNSKFEVQFEGTTFKGYYYIYKIFDDYSFAIVGDPNSNMCWLLSRSLLLTVEKFYLLAQNLIWLKYDINQFIFSPSIKITNKILF